jgi:hypothetical protein
MKQLIMKSSLTKYGCTNTFHDVMTMKEQKNSCKQITSLIKVLKKRKNKQKTFV